MSRRMLTTRTREVVSLVLMMLAATVGWSADQPDFGELSRAATSETKDPCEAGEGQRFTVMGIGGGGGMFVPSISPFDPKLMFVACDMGGTYRSIDGGRTWRMLHWRQLCDSLGCRPIFLKEAILWASGSTLKISRDKGQTWTAVGGGASPWGGDTVKSIAAAADVERLTILIGTAKGIWRSGDGGKVWRRVHEGQCYDVITVGKTTYAAVESQVLISPDMGQTWEKTSMPANQGRDMCSLAGGEGTTGSVVIYAAGKVAILQSRDAGKTWGVSTTGLGCDMIMMAGNQTQVAYAAQTGGTEVYTTRDAGRTWKPCFRMNGPGANVDQSWVQTQLKWGYYVTPLGLGVNPANANVAMISTQGDLYMTINGGNSWHQLMNKPVSTVRGEAELRYVSNGLEVTSCWEYAFDPFDSRRTYIAYTDIGFCRSIDRGRTWISSLKGCPWGNTFYQLVFDPTVRGQIYAACSDRHDIPHWMHVSANTGQKGGVCVSDDYGASWRVLGRGLPELPCTSICLDPKTRGPALTMYVTLFEGGVYKSIDGGQTWARKSQGLGNPGNLHAFMVKVHPKTGDLYCSITGFRDDSRFPVPGGLWKSSDGGDHWSDLTARVALRWPTGFAVDPRDPNVIYIAAATPPGFPQGGLHKTTDGGKTWKHIVTDADLAKSGGESYSHCMFVTLHPDQPDYVYLSTGAHGLWLSKDTGKSWQRFEYLPFRSITRVSFEPSDRKIMYVATFGAGLWTGSYVP